MAHRDGHPHVHVIVNRVDAESGKAAGFSRSKLRLSQWAEGYEQGQGWIRYSRRVANNVRRRRGERVRDRVSVSTGRHRREKIAWAPPPRGWVILQGRPRVACAMSRSLESFGHSPQRGKLWTFAPEAVRCEIVVRCPLSREGFMHRARLLAPVLLFVAGCGDGGSQTPTSPPAPPTNRAPTASTTIADQSVEEGAQVTVDISGAFSDPDGDALRYGATSDTPSVATASVSGSDLKVIGEAPGSATITVTATDPGGLSATQTFEVTVEAGSGGADLDALFAPPTADEITQVKEEWDTRTPEVSGVRPELDSEVPAGLRSVRVRILSHTVGGLRHYGAVVTPVGAEPGSLPVILYAHGGDGGVEIKDTFLLNQILQLQGLSAALVIPSYRSEPLRLGDQVFLSEGPPSPWDRDVDDTISLLSVALEQAPELDEERVAIVGFSRGGGVGLLTAARDPRIDAVVEFFGLTDLFDEYAREIFEEALDGELRDLPGLDYLNEILVLPWKLGVLSDAEARLELVRRSGVYFVDRLPPVQLHHGTEDTVVAVSQAYRLIEAMDAAGKTDQDFEEYIYAGAGHDITALIGAGAHTRAIEFLRPFLFELP